MNDPANWYVFGDQITPDVSRNGLAGGDYNVHVETNIAAFHNMNATCKNFYVSKKSHVLFEGNTCQLTVKEDLTIAAYQAPYSYWVESGSIDSNSEFNKLTVAREAIVNGGFYNMNLVLGKQSSTYTGVLNQTMSGIFIPRPSIRTLEVAPLKEKASIKCPIRVYNQIDLKNGSLIFEDNGSLHISATLPILNYRHVRYIALQDGCSIEVFFNGYESTTLPIAKILPVNGSSVVAYRPIDFRIDNASPSGSSFWQFGLETGYDASRQQESFASPLQRISHVDLWTVKKTSGPSNMKYTASLHWGATSGVNLQALSSLKLAGKTQATGTWQAVGTNITSSTGIYGSGSTHGKVISESVEYLSLGATNTSHALGNQSSPRIGTRDIAERLHAFPNPAVEKVTIKIPNLDEAAELSIISITGKELRSQTVEPGIDKLNIPRLGLTSGT